MKHTLGNPEVVTTEWFSVFGLIINFKFSLQKKWENLCMPRSTPFQNSVCTEQSKYSFLLNGVRYLVNLI